MMCPFTRRARKEVAEEAVQADQSVKLSMIAVIDFCIVRAKQALMILLYNITPRKATRNFKHYRLVHVQTTRYKRLSWHHYKNLLQKGK